MRTIIWIGLVSVLATTASSQSPPAFEVASAKRLAGMPPILSLSPQRTGNRWAWSAPRKWLVSYAYRLPEWRIAGIELDQEFYAIEARLDPSVTEDQVRLMLQKLLADRFRLASHRETKELQGYALVLATKEPKIRPATPGGQTPLMPEYMKGKDAAYFQGRLVSSAEGPGTKAIMGRGVSMSRLADAVSEAVSAFVVDKTALIGDYYFGFKFSSGVTATIADAPSLELALQEELGLKLEKQKGPVEILVVDHIEKVPVEN